MLLDRDDGRRVRIFIVAHFVAAAIDQAFSIGEKTAC